jgi:hypothetical protein
LPRVRGVHPVALAAGLWLAPRREVGTNVVAYAPAPFLCIAALVLAGWLGLLATLASRTVGKGLGAEKVAWGMHLSHLPYAPLWLVSLGAFQGLEGNIVGFIVVPFALLWGLVSVPASCVAALVAIRRMRRKAAPAGVA